MDLHVVEIHYRNADEAPGRMEETEAFRTAGVYDVAGGTVSFEAPNLPESERTGDPVTNLGLVGGHIADAVAHGLTSGKRVVVTGGNCAHLPGIVGGLEQALGPRTRIGLVWFDAHGDFNTPKTTLSGMLGGMPVAVSAGLCYGHWRELAHQPIALPTNRIVMVDVRNLDPEEERLIAATEVTVVRRGDSLADAIRRLAADTDFIYLHMDLDILDRSLTPTHPTREPNGPDVAETLEAVRAVLDSGKVGALALVAVFAQGPEGQTTMNSAIELLRGSLSAWRERVEVPA